MQFVSAINTIANALGGVYRIVTTAILICITLAAFFEALQARRQGGTT